MIAMRFKCWNIGISAAKRAECIFEIEHHALQYTHGHADQFWTFESLRSNHLQRCGICQGIRQRRLHLPLRQRRGLGIQSRHTAGQVECMTAASPGMAAAAAANRAAVAPHLAMLRC